MKNEKGFSLIELIIVIAILTILSSGVIVALWTGNNWKANKAQQVLDSTLNKTMVYAMSKGNVAGLALYELNGTYYAATISSSGKTPTGYTLDSSNIIDKTELGKAPLTISIRYKNVGDPAEKAFTLSDQSDESNMDSYAEFLYNRSSGAIKDVIIGGVSSRYTGIDVTYNSKTKKITIYSATGRHEAE